MLYAVVIQSFPSKGFTEENRAKVVAHNLSRQNAEAIQLSLSSANAGSQFETLVLLYEYADPHTAPETNECEDCFDVLLAHHQEMLSLAEQEAARRGGQILEDDLEKPQ